MAALIDEYKQAIQDVLDGRAQAAPRPSELPWTEDKLASMWAAAAAELIAEANSGGGSSGGGVLVVTLTVTDSSITADKTAGEIINAMPLVYVIQEDTGGNGETTTNFVPLSMNGNSQSAYGYKEGTGYYFYYSDIEYNEYTLIAATLDDYPSHTEL